MRKRLELIEAPKRRAMLERQMRYVLKLDGVEVSEAYYNMRGYCLTRGIPTPEGARLGLPECGISAIRREVAAMNRRFQEVLRHA